MANQEQIKKLLGAGLSQTIVAEAVGVSDSYVSQLLADPEFAKEVAAMKAKDLEKHKGMDDKYDELENKLLDKLEDLIPLMTRPRDVVSTLQVMNSAKRKAVNPGVPDGLQAGTVVQLNIPKILIQNYKVNMTGGMVEVAGRSLQAMPSASLLKSLEDRREQNAAKELPAEIIKQNIPSERIANEEKV